MKQSFDHFYSTALNPEQQQAVDKADGVLLVCAGAGSGKTRVITARMASLMLNHEVDPQTIIALTFTNKAAKEMKERIASFMPPGSGLPYVGTFHSYCLRLLKLNSHLLPFASFSLIDEDDQEKMVKQIINRFGLQKKITAKHIIAAISRIKNDGVTAQEREALMAEDQLMRGLYTAYELEKSRSRCFDFDDLLIKALELFQTVPSFKILFQSVVRHVLVDEYQDTNKVQHALLKAMTLDSENNFALDSLCVVGDEDQSIYSWRGATVSNIVNFKKDFPTTQCITLEQNYRSVQPILHVANHIIGHNQYRNPKKLWSERSAQDRVRLLLCASGYQEAEATAQFLKLMHAKKSLNSCAILYRSHFLSRALEEALMRHAIPYKIMGGIQFYERQEIKDLLAYLKLLVNPHDRIAFSRIINLPARGLGDKFEELFVATANEQPFLDFKSIARILIDQKLITKVKQDALLAFLAIFEDLSPDDAPSSILTHLLTRTGYYAYLKNSFDEPDAESKKENVRELLSALSFFETQHEKPTISLFLEEVALLQEHIKKTNQDSDFVRLMTLHAAKGLEFDHVILTGVEDGILPSAHSLYEQETIEEERRLLYVGTTRARERLLMTHARYRYTYGTMSDSRPSRFLGELPEEYVQKHDALHWSETDFSHYFAHWLSGSSLPKQPVIAQTPERPKKISKKEAWERQQQVKHDKFGVGVVEKIETKHDGSTHLTIRFKDSIKKVEASFIQSV